MSRSLFPEFFIAESLGAGSDFLGPGAVQVGRSNYLDPAPFSPATGGPARVLRERDEGIIQITQLINPKEDLAF